MRYRTIFIAFFIISCTKVYAYTPEIAFGTRQGATLSTVWFSPTVNQTMRLGYTGGITSRFIFEKYFGLQVELNYMQRGWTASAQTTTQEKFKYDREFHYIELPFMTHLFFGKKNFRWFFNLGLNLSYLIDENITTTDDIEKKKEHLQPIANRFDYGICGGTGFEIHTRAGIYQLEGRYNFGLGDVFPNKITDDFGRSSNQVITINLGILFDINKEKYKKK
ncbi:MAG: PorT family protein [Paludibacteraceae bacterium]|jgi:hypothetical protein|nr:PorT family protein [Paludibacteraceae bacterium]